MSNARLFACAGLRVAVQKENKQDNTGQHAGQQENKAGQMSSHSLVQHMQKQKSEQDQDQRVSKK